MCLYASVCCLFPSYVWDLFFKFFNGPSMPATGCILYTVYCIFNECCLYVRARAAMMSQCISQFNSMDSYGNLSFFLCALFNNKWFPFASCSLFIVLMWWRRSEDSTQHSLLNQYSILRVERERKINTKLSMHVLPYIFACMGVFVCVWFTFRWDWEPWQKINTKYLTVVVTIIVQSFVVRFTCIRLRCENSVFFLH